MDFIELFAGVYFIRWFNILSNVVYPFTDFCLKFPNAPGIAFDAFSRVYSGGGFAVQNMTSSSYFLVVLELLKIYLLASQIFF